MVQSGSVKNCNAYEYGNSAAVNCTTTPVSSFGVTGTPTKSVIPLIMFFVGGI